MHDLFPSIPYPTMHSVITKHITVMSPKPNGCWDNYLQYRSNKELSTKETPVTLYSS